MFFVHTDLMGSIRAVTDSTGQVVARYEYEPFGLTVKGEGPLAGQDVHKFTGKPEDGETGLYYFGARCYDPEVGRFTAQDPARHGLNWYEYAHVNPLKYVDPDGEEPTIVHSGTMGNIIHYRIEQALKEYVALRRLPCTVKHEQHLRFGRSYKRIDVVVEWRDGVREFYSIKQGPTWGPLGSRFLEGIEDLGTYLSLDPLAVPGTRLKVRGLVVPVPELGPDAYVRVYSDLAPGMIYYFADDGIRRQPSMATAPARSEVTVQEAATAASGIALAYAIGRAALDIASTSWGAYCPLLPSKYVTRSNPLIWFTC